MLVRSVGPGMLVLVDRGLHEYDLVAGVRQRAAHLLSRLPAHVAPTPVHMLPGGTTLARLAPADRHMPYLKGIAPRQAHRAP